MIDKYLERSEMFMLDDDGIKGTICITDEGNGECEIKTLAVYPEEQGKGYGRKLIEFALKQYKGKFHTMTVGTGDSKITTGSSKRHGLSENGTEIMSVLIYKMTFICI